MNKLIFIALFICFFSCDDGNLQIETIDFSTGVVNTCNTVAIAEKAILFKLNGSEALILNLAANTLKNEAGAYDLAISTSTSSKLIYRIFSDKATTNYFCDEIPPTTPTVIDEIIASQGTVNITTTVDETVSPIAYIHKITLENVTFITSNNQRITDLTIKEFGSITTN
jgi:hypothetical protein